MKVKNKETGTLGCSNEFNIHAISEIIVLSDEFDCSSEFIKDYEVFIESKTEWIDMSEAFSRKLILTDNLNTEFREPANDEEKIRGWYY